MYYKELARVTKFPLRFDKLDIRRGEIEEIPEIFGPSAFDLIVSNAVLEHVENLDKVCQAMRYVLKPDGIMLHVIHLFPSLTGGHNLPYQTYTKVVLGSVPPWDHLRENRFPTPIRLNRLREKNYREIFARWFDIKEWKVEVWEPKGYLSPEIRSELQNYSEEELLKRGAIVIASQK